MPKFIFTYEIVTESYSICFGFYGTQKPLYSSEVCALECSSDFIHNFSQPGWYKCAKVVISINVELWIEHTLVLSLILESEK